MRLNQYIARHSGLSRRAADLAISAGKVTVNSYPAELGRAVTPTDTVRLDGQVIEPQTAIYLALHKPIGFICSRRDQGQSPTIYALLPSQYHHLKPVGRLDKDTSGLIILTNDGTFAQTLTHPKYLKSKHYLVELTKDITPTDLTQLQAGVELDDGISNLKASLITSRKLSLTLTEGRNRQIRRTFMALGYEVITLKRTAFGKLELGDLSPREYRIIQPNQVI